ncbi:UTRA domain-containing protein [Clostridioides difficile]|nr:UTRA domain-containing protein [Clostridioides difficile]MCE4767245.1 UTRA domain-containing protein [Clostridioides difficile]MCI4687875.1 UTRA domain-containing protein [Clostridioides difficile]MCI4847357.1 UTRA domain-containing protein [Clostridioides difficile]MCJ1756950.1 UTRA domain-containing protein [Clostridioides difficile]
MNDTHSQVFSIFGENCSKITRMYYLDSKPYIFFTHYIPFDENLTVESFNNESSLYMYLYRRNINITRFEDEFFIEESELEVSKALNLAKDILLGRKRKTYDENDNIVELSFARYNTEVQNYVIKYEI